MDWLGSASPKAKSRSVWKPCTPTGHVKREGKGEEEGEGQRDGTWKAMLGLVKYDQGSILRPLALGQLIMWVVRPANAAHNVSCM